MPEYNTLFIKAFPNEKDPISFNYMVKAIEMFKTTLLTPYYSPMPFLDWPCFDLSSTDFH